MAQLELCFLEKRISMKCIKSKDKIEIIGLEEFNINQIFDCGQIFRYQIIDNEAIVVSKNHFASIKTNNDNVQITTKDLEYFERFFDLQTNYTKIKETLKKDEVLRPCCDFGYGIRLLKQDLFEMIVSFIVSANNNIKRIKNSLNYLAKNFGDKIYLDKSFKQFLLEDKVGLVEFENNKYFYYAFPTLEQLKKASVEDFVKAGLGYRAEQMYKTIQYLSQEDIDNFVNLSVEEQYKFLLSLCGVGDKVANCIMLFTKSNMKSFPVDTWINKVYNHLTKTDTQDRKKIEKELTDRYGELSGYAQQYFFYFYRENKLN